jgi:hypothetical protein
MAFTAEDGTGLALANAYVTEAFADAYFVDRGNATWAAASTGDKETAIVRATDYIDKRFGLKFKGVKQSSDQGLEWPRAGAVDQDGYVFDDVPRNLEKATAEYAVRGLSAVLAPDNTNAGVKITKKKVGPIETEQELSTPSSGTLVSPASLKEYPEADLWIQELLTDSNNRTTVRG